MKENAMERYLRLKQETAEAQRQLKKVQRAEREKLIKEVGRLFFDKCGFDSLSEYEKLCDSDGFKELITNDCDAETVNSCFAAEADDNVTLNSNVTSIQSI